MIVITDSVNFNKFAQASLKSNLLIIAKFNNSCYKITEYNEVENLYTARLMGSDVSFSIIVDDNFIRSSDKSIIKAIGEVTFSLL